MEDMGEVDIGFPYKRHGTSNGVPRPGCASLHSTSSHTYFIQQHLLEDRKCMVRVNDCSHLTLPELEGMVSLQGCYYKHR